MELTRRDVLAGSVAGLATIAGCGGDSEPGTPPEDGSTPDLQVGSSTITSREASCGSTPSASLTVSESTVAILGTIVAPDPCHVASLEEAYIEGDALRFAVDAVPDEEAEGCSECVAAVPFELTAPIERGSPGAVSIEVLGQEPETFQWTP